MTTTALDALARLDDGLASPADRMLAAQHDLRLQHAAAVQADRLREFEFTAWLALQCPICEEGGGATQECDAHVLEMEDRMKRLSDV